ncbi:MAG: putative RDD family membrane protein YckC [Gammaproteobacteria bacterium]|jgi:uncharacterized RDD family membrane protein YckC
MNDVDYAGFWIRTLAAIVDTIMIMFIVFPLLFLIYGEKYLMSESVILGYWDVMLNYVLPAIVIILFWIYKSATPGKMLLKLKIVDAKTGGKPSAGQLVGRYLGYYVSMLPFFLGIIWVGFDSRKQGWHDKLAGTVVIRSLNQEER